MRPLSETPPIHTSRQSFSSIPVEAGDIKREWTMFTASISEAAAGGLKVIGNSRSGNPRTPWWAPVVREAIRLKKEAFRDVLSQGTPEAIARYRQAQRTAASVVTAGVGGVWRGHGEGRHQSVSGKLLDTSGVGNREPSKLYIVRMGHC